MRLFFSILLISIVLAGCASTNIFYEYNKETEEWDPKYKTDTKGAAKTDLIIKDGKIAEIHQDSKSEPLLNVEIPATKFGG